ncbi:HAMP domain-containing sensor histidine kinase [Olivibacter sp. CPCC 100613]|uniref:sensor histidine kinase n=1 Tax=Olivibacter sp. CPCC 100613 TaxID=3079931 RepID=UPI002FFC84A0
MKLSNKLLLFTSCSKLIIVIIFILILPLLVQHIASQYTNYILEQQKRKVLIDLKRNGLNYYLQGDTEYGSYTMLKEEYIAIEPTSADLHLDNIKESKRIVENDTLNYRILSFTFQDKGQAYLLEIGKTVNSINQYNKPLQRFTLYTLIVLIALTLIIDLTFLRLVIQPLRKIIRMRLFNRKFPFKDQQPLIKTSTSDFRYLDESLLILMNQVNEAFEKEKEFTANASHELMTPISILQSKMENLLSEDELDEALARHIVEMMKTLTRLKKISGSLLLISRIDNEQFAKSDVVYPKDLIQDVIEELAIKLEEKQIESISKLTINKRLTNVNKDLLFHLFYNLINNAIKFNVDRGQIVIQDAMLNTDYYEIIIQDTGIGIDEKQLPLIFDRFKKSGNADNMGYGLGLTIVKSICNYHHIQLHVQSIKGRGSTFKLLFFN